MNNKIPTPQMNEYMSIIVDIQNCSKKRNFVFDLDAENAENKIILKDLLNKAVEYNTTFSIKFYISSDYSNKFNIYIFKENDNCLPLTNDIVNKIFS